MSLTYVFDVNLDYVLIECSECDAYDEFDELLSIKEYLERAHKLSSTFRLDDNQWSLLILRINPKIRPESSGGNNFFHSSASSIYRYDAEIIAALEDYSLCQIRQKSVVMDGTYVERLDGIEVIFGKETDLQLMLTMLFRKQPAINVSMKAVTSKTIKLTGSPHCIRVDDENLPSCLEESRDIMVKRPSHEEIIRVLESLGVKVRDARHSDDAAMPASFWCEYPLSGFMVDIPGVRLTSFRAMLNSVRDLLSSAGAMLSSSGGTHPLSGGILSSTTGMLAASGYIPNLSAPASTGDMPVVSGAMPASSGAMFTSSRSRSVSSDTMLALSAEQRENESNMAQTITHPVPVSDEHSRASVYVGTALIAEERNDIGLERSDHKSCDNKEEASSCCAVQ